MQAGALGVTQIFAAKLPQSSIVTVEWYHTMGQRSPERYITAASGRRGGEGVTLTFNTWPVLPALDSESIYLLYLLRKHNHSFIGHRLEHGYQQREKLYLFRNIMCLNLCA